MNTKGVNFQPSKRGQFSAAVDSQNGEWWDPVGNVCRPTLAPFPPNCGDGQYWNPVSNACRPLGLV